MICWCLFVIFVISISRLVRLFTRVLYWLKPVTITHYLANVYDDCWLFSYFPFLTYIRMHIFCLNSLFIKFLHMFVLPDIASSSIAGVELGHVVFSSTNFSCELTETLNMIFLTNHTLPFYDIKYISMTCMNISDVASSSIAGVELGRVVFSSTNFSCELTETLNMIFLTNIIPCLFMT